MDFYNAIKVGMNPISFSKLKRVFNTVPESRDEMLENSDQIEKIVYKHFLKDPKDKELASARMKKAYQLRFRDKFKIEGLDPGVAITDLINVVEPRQQMLLDPVNSLPTVKMQRGGASVNPFDQMITDSITLAMRKY